MDPRQAIDMVEEAITGSECSSVFALRDGSYLAMVRRIALDDSKAWSTHWVTPKNGVLSRTLR